MKLKLVCMMLSVMSAHAAQRDASATRRLLFGPSEASRRATAELARELGWRYILTAEASTFESGIGEIPNEIRSIVGAIKSQDKSKLLLHSSEKPGKNGISKALEHELDALMISPSRIINELAEKKDSKQSAKVPHLDSEATERSLRLAREARQEAEKIAQRLKVPVDLVLLSYTKIEDLKMLLRWERISHDDYVAALILKSIINEGLATEKPVIIFIDEIGSFDGQAAVQRDEGAQLGIIEPSFPKKGDYQAALAYVKQHTKISEIATKAMASFIAREGRIPNKQELDFEMAYERTIHSSL